MLALNKAALAKYLVIVAGRSIDASYSAYVRSDKGEWPKWWDGIVQSSAMSYICRFLIPIASKLDRNATGAQMAEEGWWG
jgi:hypothetical protein